MEQMGLREADYTAVAAPDPVRPDLPLEDDLVLIVDHFRDSSQQRIWFPSSDDSVCRKENSGRVEDPGEGFARKRCFLFSGTVWRAYNLRISDPRSSYPVHKAPT